MTLPICVPSIPPDSPAAILRLSAKKGEAAMTEETFRLRFEELTTQIDQLPADQQPRLRKLAEETLARYRTNKTNIDQASAALDDWRLQAKYQLFDTEAELRERQQDLEDYESN